MDELEHDPIRRLIFYAADNGFGITFEPRRDQWKIGWMRRMGGGDLTTAVTLEEGCAAALAPLDELIEPDEQRS